jgi:hypothetical protein
VRGLAARAKVVKRRADRVWERSGVSERRCRVRPPLHARELVMGLVADAFVWDSCVIGPLVGCVVVRLGVQVGAEET